MPPPPPDDALVVSPSARGHILTAVPIALFLSLYVIGGMTGLLDGPLVLAGVVIFGAVLVVGIVGARRARGAPWELRLDASGITVRGHPPVPWSDLAEVRVTGLRPRWFF